MPSTDTGRRGIGGSVAPARAAFLDAIFAQSATALITVDEAGAIVYASPGTAVLFGHAPTSIVGMSIFSALHPEDVEAGAAMFAARIKREGVGFGTAIRIRHASGGWTTANVYGALLPDPELGVCAFTLEVTGAEDQRERSLRRQLVVERYANGLGADFMTASGSDGVLSRLEQALGEIGGLTGAGIVAVFMERAESRILERLGRWVADAHDVGPGLEVVDLEDHQLEINDFLTTPMVVNDIGGPSTDLAVEVARSVGGSGFLSAPFRVGRQRGAIVAIRLDPGPAWSRADEQLVSNVAELTGRALQTARTEELLALTYREGPLGFSIRTWEGALIDCNRQYLELQGISREQADQLALTELLHPDDHEMVRTDLARLRSGSIDRVIRDTRAARPDGSVVWLRVNAVRLDAPGSRETYVLTSLEDITENREQQSKLEYQANHDSLTGVATRDAMQEAIARFATTEDGLPALLILDLDRFKLINDSMGHMVGDEVLLGVVERIQEEVRAIDVVARIGGDEFAVVVPAITTEGVARLADRLRRSLEVPLLINGREIPQTISIGVAMGTDCADVAELLVRADRAMYAAKAKGRNQSVVFDESMRDEVLARLALERELRYAIDHGQLEVHFQPEFALDNLKIVGAEALVRWEHPMLGTLAADHFIEIAEHTGMIDDIGRFALRRACRDFARIVEACGRDDLALRVNISGREFARTELPDLVRSALEMSGVAPDRLCLEMTEMTLMDAPEVALETFARLRSIGVKFAIDDFGTGYSSLAYLKRFPVDALKIDRGFIEDLTSNTDSQAIVESILSLSASLGLDVVAEGVETHEQREYLIGLGCERAQGYLVSKALSPHEFVEIARRSV